MLMIKVKNTKNFTPILHVLHALAEQLTSIFNVSFQEQIFPDKLKVGAIYPIHKTDSKSACSNYRLISVLPVFRKILEKLMRFKG